MGEKVGTAAAVQARVSGTEALARELLEDRAIGMAIVAQAEVEDGVEKERWRLTQRGQPVLLVAMRQRLRGSSTSPQVSA